MIRKLWDQVTDNNDLQRGKGEQKIQCSEGLQAVSARPFGKGWLETIKTVEGDGKAIVSGLQVYDAQEF